MYTRPSMAYARPETTTTYILRVACRAGHDASEGAMRCGASQKSQSASSWNEVRVARTSRGTRGLGCAFPFFALMKVEFLWKNTARRRRATRQPIKYLSGDSTQNVYDSDTASTRGDRVASHRVASV